MFDTLRSLIDAAPKIVVIQPENPDGDSLGSSLALEAILGERGKEVTLYCAIQMPKYLHYIQGWDRVVNDWNGKYDMAIIVDTATESLVEKALQVPGVRHFLETHPVVVIDHHSDADDANDMSFPHEYIVDETAAATGELLHYITSELGWGISQQAAENLYVSIAADTLGLTTPGTTASTYRVVTQLVEAGVVPAEVESRRREYMRKPADILSYKAQLIDRIEYYCDGRLATIHIPWDEIQTYSDRYNPSILVLDEMRLVEGVDIAVAIKTYPDGKLTGKVRSNIPIADTVAGFFGGGGHAYSAGFKIHEQYEVALGELVSAVDKSTGAAHETA